MLGTPVGTSPVWLSLCSPLQTLEILRAWFWEPCSSGSCLGTWELNPCHTIACLPVSGRNWAHAIFLHLFHWILDFFRCFLSFLLFLKWQAKGSDLEGPWKMSFNQSCSKTEMCLKYMGLQKRFYNNEENRPFRPRHWWKVGWPLRIG